MYSAEGLMSLNAYFKTNWSSHAIWGKTYNVAADIDATGYTWETVWLNTPSSTTNDGFVLDGNNHTITNLTINGSGLFGGSANSTDKQPTTIKNLTIDGGKVTGTYHAAVIWGTSYGDLVLENVHVKNQNVTGNSGVSALVGRNDQVSGLTIAFKNCSVTDTKITATGNGDPVGASVFLGTLLSGNNASATVTFDGCAQSGNTLTSAEGQVGGGIYACWNYTNNTTSVVTEF